MLNIPYVPTPIPIVFEMLKLANVKENEIVVDPGAGDCRIPIIAAKHFKAIGIGIEINPYLVSKCIENIKLNNLIGRVFVFQLDLMKFNYSIADVVTLYLGLEMNERLRPKLERELKPGARVVSHDFEVPGWKPSKVIEVKSDIKLHKLYLYEF